MSHRKGTAANADLPSDIIFLGRNDFRSIHRFLEVPPFRHRCGISSNDQIFGDRQNRFTHHPPSTRPSPSGREAATPQPSTHQQFPERRWLKRRHRRLLLLLLVVTGLHPPVIRHWCRGRASKGAAPSPSAGASSVRLGGFIPHRFNLVSTLSRKALY